MAANERAYLNKGNYRNHVDLLVHHEHKVSNTNSITASGLSLAGAAFQFYWFNTVLGNNGKYSSKDEYSWLRPIKV